MKKATTGAKKAAGAGDRRRFESGLEPDSTATAEVRPLSIWAIFQPWLLRAALPSNVIVQFGRRRRAEARNSPDCQFPE